MGVWTWKGEITMDWKLIENKAWDSLEQHFEWVRDMNDVQQSTAHHAEGNVGIHTRMVLEALQQSSGYQALTAQNQEIVWTAALLHDVEKRSTSVDEGEGKISAKGHARKGEFTARTLLYRDFAAPFAVREQIAALVRYHGLPLWWSEKLDPTKSVCEASLRVDTSLLKLLAEADIRGRICNDKHELLDTLELFEMFCREQGCWAAPRAFANNNARFHYFDKENSYIDFVPHENFKCEVTLLSGLPAMGKDHYLQSVGADTPVVSLDAIRRKYKLSPTDKSANGWVVQTAKEEARSYLRKRQDFIWNATNITRQMRTQLIDLFTDYGAKVKIVYLERPYNVWRKQNRNREYVVPKTVLDTMLSKLEVPLLTEAHEVLYYTL